MDFEIRWVKRFNAPGIVQHGEDGVTYLAIQTRQREGPRNDGWWGEWVDVPLEDLM